MSGPDHKDESGYVVRQRGGDVLNRRGKGSAHEHYGARTQKNQLPFELDRWLNSPRAPNAGTQRQVRQARDRVDYRTWVNMAQQGYDEAVSQGWRGAPKGSLEHYRAQRRAMEVSGTVTQQPSKDTHANTSSRQNKSPDSHKMPGQVANVTGKATQPQQVPYPSFNVDLTGLPEVSIPWGPGTMKIEVTGSLTLQKKGNVNPIALDQSGYKVEASKVLRDVTTVSLQGYMSPKRRVLSYTTAIQGKWNATTLGFEVGNGGISIISETQPRPVKFEYKQWIVTGTMGYKFTYTSRPQLPWYERALEKVKDLGEQAMDWISDNAVALGLIAGGTVLIAFTVGEDILTLGGGITDDPASMAAGMGLITKGVNTIK